MNSPTRHPLVQGLCLIPALWGIALPCVLIWLTLHGSFNDITAFNYPIFVVGAWFLVLSESSWLAADLLVVGVGFILALIEWKLFRAAFVAWSRWSASAARELFAAVFFVISVVGIPCWLAAVPQEQWLVTFIASVVIAYVFYQLALLGYRCLIDSPTGSER